MQIRRGLVIGLITILAVTTGVMAAKEWTALAQLQGGRWVFWDATFRVEDFQPILTKQVTLWDLTPTSTPYWERLAYQEFEIPCEPVGAVTVLEDHIIFERGGHLMCHDIDLETVLAGLGVKPEEISPLATCSYAIPGVDSLCMQSAQIEIEAEVETSDISGHYPIFSYPQQITKQTTNYLEFGTDVDPGHATQTIDWAVYGFNQMNQLIQFQESVGNFWPFTGQDEAWYNLQVRQIRLPNSGGTYFEYRVDGITQGFSNLREAWYEFPAHADVIFYFGDRAGEIPEGGTLKFRSARVDPMSVCGSCY